MKLSKNLQSGCLVNIVHDYSMNKFHLNAIDDLRNIDQLIIEIEEFVNTASPMDTDIIPKIGEIVIAPYCGVYQRAKVVSITLKQDNKHEAKVEFIDFGDECSVMTTQLFSIPTNSVLMEHPIYGVKVVMWRVQQRDLPAIVDKCRSPSLLNLESYLGVVKKHGGQIEKLDERNGVWMGRLWVAKDKTWTDLVLEALEAYQNEIPQNKKSW